MPEEELQIVLDGKETATDVMRNVMQSLVGLEETAKVTNANMRDTFMDLRRSIMDENRAVNTLGMAFKDENREIFLFTGALSSTGTVLSRITNAYQQYNVMQIRSQQATEAVAQAQDRYNTAVEKFGSSSQQAQSALQNLNSTQERAAQVTSQNEVAMVGLVSQVGLQLPNAIANCAMAWSKFGGFTGITTSLSSAFSGLGGSVGLLSTILPPLAVAFAFVGTSMGAQEAATKGVGAELATTVMHGHKYIDMENFLVDLGPAAAKGQNDLADSFKRVSEEGAALTRAGGGLGANAAYIKYMEDLQAWTDKRRADAARPITYTINVDVDSDEAEDKLESVNEAVANIPEQKTVTIQMMLEQFGEGLSDWLGSLLSFQHGGTVPGTGPQLAVVHGGERFSGPMTMHMTNYQTISSDIDRAGLIRDIQRSVVEGYRQLCDMV